jgi:hypothetical protein
MRFTGRVLVASLPVLVGAGLTMGGARAATAPALVAEHVTRLTPAGGFLQLRAEASVSTGINTEMVGFDWDGSAPGEIRVRGLSQTGWSAWQTADSDPALSPDVGSKEFRGRSSAGPVWLGHDIRRVQFQVTKGELPNLRLHAIYSSYTAPRPVAAEPAVSLAGGGVSQPPIITRAQWGADESYRTYAPGCDGSVGYADNVHYLIVHHTVTGNAYGPSDSAAIIRGIYYFHTHTRLWCDIGYNFLIDQYGQIFEGRYGGITQPVVGSQAGGFNTGSSGVALLGTFTTTPPSAAMFSALRRLAGWEATIHGINPDGTVTIRAGDFPVARWAPGTEVTLPTIIGHRDVEFTDCPGDAAYAELPALRADVAQDVGGAWARAWSGYRLAAAAPRPGIVGAPGVSSWGIDRLDVFARGRDNQLYHRASTDGGAAFSGWERLGAPPGGVLSSPAVVSWGYGRIDIFVQGAKRALWHESWSGSWSGWENLGGALTSAPAVSSWGAGRLDVFVAGVGGVLYHLSYQTAWSGWEGLGGATASSPGAASWGPGHIDLFAVGPDGTLWHKAYTGVWSGWLNEVPGRFAYGVAAASWGPGRLDVFAASNTPGKPTAHLFYDNGWHTESLGGSLSAGPAAVSWLYNRLDVFARGLDGTIWHNRYPGS